MSNSLTETQTPITANVASNSNDLLGLHTDDMKIGTDTTKSPNDTPVPQAVVKKTEKKYNPKNTGYAGGACIGPYVRVVGATRSDIPDINIKVKYYKCHINNGTPKGINIKLTSGRLETLEAAYRISVLKGNNKLRAYLKAKHITADVPMVDTLFPFKFIGNLYVIVNETEETSNVVAAVPTDAIPEKTEDIPKPKETVVKESVILHPITGEPVLTSKIVKDNPNPKFYMGKVLGNIRCSRIAHEDPNNIGGTVIEGISLLSGMTIFRTFAQLRSDHRGWMNGEKVGSCGIDSEFNTQFKVGGSKGDLEFIADGKPEVYRSNDYGATNYTRTFKCRDKINGRIVENVSVSYLAKNKHPSYGNFIKYVREHKGIVEYERITGEKWKGKEKDELYMGIIHRSTFNRMKYDGMCRMKDLGLTWEITIDDVCNKLKEQNYRCARTGKLITGFPLPRKLRGENRIVDRNLGSIDRKDRKIGYIRDNIQITTNGYNMSKGMYSDEDLKNDICNPVVVKDVECKNEYSNFSLSEEELELANQTIIRRTNYSVGSRLYDNAVQNTKGTIVAAKYLNLNVKECLKQGKGFSVNDHQVDIQTTTYDNGDIFLQYRCLEEFKDVSILTRNKGDIFIQLGWIDYQRFKIKNKIRNLREDNMLSVSIDQLEPMSTLPAYLSKPKYSD